MEGKITYHQQVSYCGKLRCRKCREGIGHGPYWYAYQTMDGQTTRTYIGKHLPAEVQAAGTTQFSDTPDTPDTPANPTNPAQPHPASPPQTSLVLLRIFTLGQFRLERRVANRWHAVNDSDWLRSNRMRALLALLICSPGRRVSRVHAIEVLKLGKDPSTAGSRLDTTLRRLRKILHHSSTSRASRALREAQVQDMLLRSEGDTLVLADQSIIWIDADAFESFTTRRQALSSEVTEEASSLPRSSLPAPASPLTASEAARLAELREAVALYQGDFLPEGKQLAWVATRRRLLHHAWIALLLELSDLYIANAEMTAAIETLNLLLTHDPAHEAAIQRLIVTLAKLQRRGEAIRAYQQFADVLAREQQAVPSEETQRLVRAIREGRDLPHTLSSHTATEQEISPSEAVSPSSSPLERLAGHLQIMPVGRSNQSPLVGRDAELDTLRRMLLEIEQNAQVVEEQRQVEQQASSIPFYTQRRPQCAVLLGEIGIGKTRLAEEICRVAQRRNCAIVWSRVSAQESTIPYRLWAEVLRRALYISSELLPASFTSSAHAGEEATGLGNGSEMSLPALLRPLSMILPEISEILPQTKALPASQFAAEPGQEQLRLWQAAHTLLTLLSTNVPLLLVLDDIQWADSNSCDLFGHLCRHLSGYPILIVATCRANEFSANQRLHTLIAHMQREHSVMTLNIAPLSTEQIGTLVTGVSPLPAATVRYIQSQAAGIPLFAEELARSHAGATSPALPESVTAALEQRLRKLSQDCHELLKSAAVLGSSFELPLIETMIEGSDQPGEEEALVLLEEALQSGVLTEEGMGNHITYHFWHPLLVDHLYQSISATRRARLHLRAAEALIQLYRDNEETVAATITHHLVRADAEPLRIAAYAELAGQQAYALLAYKEATQHYALAVAKLDQAALASGTASGEQPPQEALTHLIFLLERLAECNMICGNYQEARKLYERILSLRHQVSLPDALLEAQIQALLWSEIGWTWRYETDSTRAWHCCTEGERVLRKAGVALARPGRECTTCAAASTCRKATTTPPGRPRAKSCFYWSSSRVCR
ncbi:MAG: AAA family ATPase [Ktedonobacteraceae bacterium]|nr:AAA family ATPase [Ktedonobacteraceae bacterium]